jgi:GT2 family glycosyltransferase
VSKTSIIIAVFNRVQFLRSCLLSLKHQSIVPDEVILTDDGSTMDVVSQIQDVISDLDARVHYVRQPNKGFRLARCRNNGVRIATGDYLIFIDQDIVCTEHFIKTFIDHRRAKRFCVSYPIRLSPQQTERCTGAVIEQFNFESIIDRRQTEKIHKQYRKDRLYAFLKKLRLSEIGPKLRGGVAAINREDFVNVNGYDEYYRGWGNEDDDLGRRLYKAGITGMNPFFHEFPLHLYHPPHHVNGTRVNQEYYQQRIAAIRAGESVCECGFEHPLDEDDEELTVVNLK